jgi:hypothetical protein
MYNATRIDDDILYCKNQSEHNDNTQTHHNVKWNQLEQLKLQQLDYECLAYPVSVTLLVTHPWVVLLLSAARVMKLSRSWNFKPTSRKIEMELYEDISAFSRVESFHYCLDVFFENLSRDDCERLLKRGEEKIARSL